MLSGLKSKLLALSGSFNFYKNNYEKLSSENNSLKNNIKHLENEIVELKKEREEFLSSILSNQEELSEDISSFKDDDVKKIVFNQNKTFYRLDKIHTDFSSLFELNRESVDGIASRLSTDELVFDEFYRKNDIALSDLSDKTDFVRTQLSSKTEGIVDALLSQQESFAKYMKSQNDLLSDIEELGLRVEKSSAYTNIKLDSKFDANERLLMRYSNELRDKVDCEK